MIVIFGATGNVGGKVARKLSEKDVPFLGVASQNSAHPETTKLKKGNLMNPAFLEQILHQAEAVFIILPESLYAQGLEYASLLVKTIEKSTVTHVVNISNAITHRNGKPTLLNQLEQELNRLESVHIKHLRCANFFENLNLGLSNGYNGDLKLPYISTHEVAHFASEYLIHRNFSGHTIEELHGPADYSMNDFATITGVPFVQQELTEENRTFYEPFNNGQFRMAERTIHNTTSLPQPEFYLDHFFEKESNLKI
ncbi:MAG TPA: NAD(P)H-binding protein [Sphingobacteriaceae bacterium]